MSALLTLQGVCSGYDASQVLFGVDFEVGQAEVATLLGRNGMGKTTTLKTVFGLLPCWEGDIYFLGERINGLATEKIAQMGLAIVPEGRRIFPNLTVKENLVAFASHRNSSTLPWSLERVYELFPALKARADNMGNQLSGGEQQMLAIGRALLTNPHLIILDEATEGLSPLVRAEIWQVLQRLKNEGQAIVVIDKYLKELSRIADSHCFVEKGRSCWRGSNQEMLADDTLWQKYLGV